MKKSQTVFEKSQAGQKAYSLPKNDSAFQQFLPPKHLLRGEPASLPETSELDLTRHFCGLAKKNIGIDTNFYPLGSCTMKLNPRVNEWCAALPAFQQTHPLADDAFIQGNLEVMHGLMEMLCKATGMNACSLSPNAGAQGEFVGVQMIAAYHRKRGDKQRTEMLIPDSAHGTNPATAQMSGYKTVSIRSQEDGDIDLDHLKALVSERTAGLMLTNPSTLGLFSPSIMKIAEIVHSHGGLLYYDGANLNAILNVARIGAMGFDVMHINLHKTFSTPHGGGGPGGGPVLCNTTLKEFLPVPHIALEGGSYSRIWKAADTIGQISSFQGNFGICLRAYIYAKLHGHFGLKRNSEMAVLNANYLKKCLSSLFTIPYKRHCMHEFVVQADRFVDKGIRALDIVKCLLDYGIHAPTIYFPLIVKECMLIEPAESESKATLDEFVEVLHLIAEEIERDPEIVKQAPHTTPTGRLDEVRAAKQLILKHQTSTVLVPKRIER